jgi:hypothetical protein
LITNDDFIEWGKKLYDKAQSIQLLEVAHKSKVVLIIEGICKKYKIKDKILIGFDDVTFGSFMLKGHWPGQEEVKYYWLKNIVNYPGSFISRSWEDTTREIIENKNPPWIIDQFNKNDFFDDGEFKITYPGDHSKNLNILVPYSLNYYQIEFAIQVIENVSKSKVSKISFWYFTHFLFFGNDYCKVEIGVDDNDKYNHHPFILKKDFLNLKFSSFENWYENIPEFQNYINQKNDEARAKYPKCATCENSDNVIDQTLFGYYWCSHCEHAIDYDGSCISENCQTCL